MSDLHPEYTVELTPKEHLVRALKSIVKVSEYADQEEKLISFAKFCFLKEPKMTSVKYYIDAEHTEFNVQIGITICVKDFDAHSKRTKAPKHGVWTRLSELNEKDTAKFIVSSGASCWINVLAVHVDDGEELSTEDLRLSCSNSIYELYVGQLMKHKLEALDGVADNYRFDGMEFLVDSPEANNWYICPIAEDVE